MYIYQRSLRVLTVVMFRPWCGELLSSPRSHWRNTMHTLFFKRVLCFFFFRTLVSEINNRNFYRKFSAPLHFHSCLSVDNILTYISPTLLPSSLLARPDITALTGRKKTTTDSCLLYWWQKDSTRSISLSFLFISSCLFLASALLFHLLRLPSTS